MSLAVYFSYPARVTCYQEHRIQSAGCNRLQVFPGTVMQEKGVKETWNIGIYCWCQPAKSIRSQEHAQRGWERKLQQRNSTAKMGSRGSDTSPRRDAVWPRLSSASYIYTGEREKDKTVSIFLGWPIHLTKSHKKSWEHGNGTLLLFLTPDNISLCVRSLSRTPGVCSK